MDKEHISLALELSGETLTGLARNGSGRDRPFAGWLGLLGAIDALIDEKSAGHEQSAGGSRATQRPEAADSPQPARPKENR